VPVKSGEESKTLRWIKEVRAAIFVQRSTILISLFAAGMLAFPAATREIYRILANDIYHLATDAAQNVSHGTSRAQIGFAFVSLLLASSMIWYVGRDLAWQLHGDAPGPRSLLLRWLPVVCAMLLPLAASWGVYQAALDMEAISSLSHVAPNPPTVDGYPSPMSETQEQLEKLLAHMRHGSKILLYGAIFCLFLTAALVTLLARANRRQSAPFSASTRYALLLMAAGTFALFSFSLIGLPRLLGTIALFNLFVTVLALIVGRGIYINDRFGVPVLLLAIVAALGFSVFELNDNHIVPVVKSKNTGRDQFATGHFKDWFDSRTDRAAYPTQPYPVFIVSAAGGGLYAAQYTARFLARMQDRCPHFAQHIFAISGVSGGSVGAAVFTSVLLGHGAKQVAVPSCTGLAKKSGGGDPLGPLEQSVVKMLGKDYLSPIVAAALFPDFLQRFLPRAFSQFDRGRVLDDSLEAAWHEQFPNATANPLAMPMLDLWDRKDAVPALVLNATHVATGDRFAMAPFWPQRAGQILTKLQWLQGHLQNGNVQNSNVDHPTGFEDLKLSTAAGISARFPWIMPAATVRAPKQNENRKNNNIRLVDGGYFENSGTETVGDLIRAIEKPGMIDGHPAFKIYVIILTSYDNDLFGGNFDDDTPLAEFIGPIRGLLSTRQARADLTIVRTLDYLCPDLKNCNSETEERGWHNRARWIFATLNLIDSQLPLSWHLSETSGEFIGFHAGSPNECGNAYHATVPDWTNLPPKLAEKAKQVPRLLGGLNTANCAASVVCGQLANKKLAFEPEPNRTENYCTSWETTELTPASAASSPSK
jgi:hypothetical protein